MARVKRAVHSKKGRRKILERAKGYKGSRSRRLRAANEQVMNAMQDAYGDRRTRKGDFRKLWIARINAAARQHGTTYSRLIAGLKANEVEIDRKMLAELWMAQLPSPEHQRDLHFVALIEELQNATLLPFVVVVVRLWPELHFLDDCAGLLLASFSLADGLLVLVLPEVHQPADGWPCIGGDLHEVQPELAREPSRLLDLLHPDLAAIGCDDSHLLCPDLVVDPEFLSDVRPTS